jgi:hypothetical protein
VKPHDSLSLRPSPQRVLYEIKELRNLQVFLDKVIVAVKELGNLVFIVILTTLIFALLGMQLFGGKMGAGETLSRSNFDEVFGASITTFQVLTGDDWPSVMWDAMTGAGPAFALFFVALIIIGRHMVLSLFIAVLLDSLWKARRGLSTLWTHPFVSSSAVTIACPIACPQTFVVRRGPPHVTGSAQARRSEDAAKTTTHDDLPGASGWRACRVFHTQEYFLALM